MENKVVVIRDALSKKNFQICLTEVKSYQKKTIQSFKDDHREYSNRWYPEPHTTVPNIIEKLIWSKKVRKKILPLGDLSWKWFLIGKTVGFEVQATFYSKPDDHYDWHVDHVHLKNDLSAGRVLNYILYLTELKGGELQLSDDFGLADSPKRNIDYHVGMTIKPEKNKLVIIPSWIPHRVLPTPKGERITINGHIGL